MTSKTIEDVESFWNNNPLWTGESNFESGSKDFFLEHKKVYYEDCFAGKMDEKIFPQALGEKKILDLGCGVGFWTIELGERGVKELFAADLTENALTFTKKRCETFGIKANLSKQNAENLTFKDGFFDHINCQGVIHHTPDTQLTVKEIARVLNASGTACISVYYKNFFIRNWKVFSWIGKTLFYLGAGMKGRGREKIYDGGSIEEIVRLYDGIENPIGKAYTRQEYIDLLSPYFEIDLIFFHFFPARSLPFRIPRWVHKVLDRKIPFMIYANLKKK